MFFLGLINFNESAMLQLRELVEAAWHVEEASIGPGGALNATLVTAGLPATREAPAYLALGQRRVSTLGVELVRAEDGNLDVGLSMQIGDTYADQRKRLKMSRTKRMKPEVLTCTGDMIGWGCSSGKIRAREEMIARRWRLLVSRAAAGCGPS